MSKGASGHRYQIYRHRHIRQGLDDNQQSAAQHQEFRKELITSTSNHPHPDKQADEAVAVTALSKLYDGAKVEIKQE